MSSAVARRARDTHLALPEESGEGTSTVEHDGDNRWTHRSLIVFRAGTAGSAVSTGVVSGAWSRTRDGDLPGWIAAAVPPDPSRRRGGARDLDRIRRDEEEGGEF